MSRTLTYPWANSRRDQAAIMKEVGTSLADIAAYMYQVELMTGIAPRSRDALDRMRTVALRMQKISPDVKAD